MPKNVPKQVAPGSSSGKVVRPSKRREMAKKGLAKHGISVRLACVVYGISDTCYRCQAKLNRENALVTDSLREAHADSQTLGFWIVLLVSAQCEVLRLEPQACVPHLPGAKIEYGY